MIDLHALRTFGAYLSLCLALVGCAKDEDEVPVAPETLESYSQTSPDISFFYSRQLQVKRDESRDGRSQSIILVPRSNDPINQGNPRLSIYYFTGIDGVDDLDSLGSYLRTNYPERTWNTAETKLDQAAGFVAQEGDPDNRYQAIKDYYFVSGRKEVVRIYVKPGWYTKSIHDAFKSLQIKL